MPPPDDDDYGLTPATSADASSDDYGLEPAQPAKQPKSQFAPGAVQTKKGGKVYANAADAAKEQRDAEKAGAAASEAALAGFVPGGELTEGAVKGALSTGRNLGGLGIRALRYISPSLGNRAAAAWPEAANGTPSEAMQPQSVPAKIGKAAEQTAEFFLPGEGEEKLAATLAEKSPMLGKAALPIAKLLTKSASTGAVNAAQGGSFSGGALTGAITHGIGEAGKALAPSLMESALGVTRKMRGFGKTPGEAALNEIEGVRPGTIAENAQEKLRQLTTELETKAAQSTVPASTAPALAVLDREQAKAVSQNNKAVYDQLQAIRQQLTTEFQSGNPIPTQISAKQALDLKRGIGSLEKSWNPEQRGATKGVVRKIYGALDKELDNAVPGADKLNQRISSLITVGNRAESTERGADFTQRALHRAAAHTGALTGAVGGGLLGYRKGGYEGAGIGAVAGLALPELIASPTAQTSAARLLSSGPQLSNLGRRAILPAKRALQQ